MILIILETNKSTSQESTLLNEFINLASYQSWNALKVLSKHRFHCHKRLHFGIVAHNDQIRFNIFIRPPANKLEDQNCIQTSEIFDLKVDPKTNTIINASEYNNFLSILSAVMSSNHNEMIDIFEKYNQEAEVLLSKQQNSNFIRKLNQTFDVESTKSLWNIWTSSNEYKATNNNKTSTKLSEVDYKKNIIDKLRSNHQNNLI